MERKAIMERIISLEERAQGIYTHYLNNGYIDADSDAYQSLYEKAEELREKARVLRETLNQED